MLKRVTAICVVLTLILSLALFAGHKKERDFERKLQEKLHLERSDPAKMELDIELLEGLPQPVQRYFRYALGEQKRLIRTVQIEQSGELRTSPSESKWMSFEAEQIIVPSAPGFIWNAKVALPLFTHLRVLDAFVSGTGLGRISALTAIELASESNIPELTSGALQRYLAESVWVPTALLPQSGVVWEEIDDLSARASLTNGKTTVSVDFHFNVEGEIISFYGVRYRKVQGSYVKTPWRGHLSDYKLQQGVRIPFHGEVGWEVEGRFGLVWKGYVDKIRILWSAP